MFAARYLSSESLHYHLNHCTNRQWYLNWRWDLRVMHQARITPTASSFATQPATFHTTLDTFHHGILDEAGLHLDQSLSRLLLTPRLWIIATQSTCLPTSWHHMYSKINFVSVLEQMTIGYNMEGPGPMVDYTRWDGKMLLWVGQSVII